MVAQPLHIINRFSANVVEELLIRGIQAARKHELLPDHDSHLVTQFVKIVRLVNATTPDSQHIHVAVAHRLDEEAIFVFGDTRRKTVGWNPIAALRENGNAIDDEHKAFSRFVARSPQFQGPEAGPRYLLTGDSAVYKTTCTEIVKWLRAEP